MRWFGSIRERRVRHSGGARLCTAVALAIAASSACSGGSPGVRTPAAAPSAVVDPEPAPVTAGAPASTGSQYALPLRGASPTASFPFRPLDRFAAETRVARLSHGQYRHTLQDLFGFEELPNFTLSPDALNGFSFDTSNAFRVDARLGPQYRGVAEELAARAVQDDAVFALLVPCRTELPNCRDQFLRAFGERAFRRPLSDEDVATFGALFDSGAASYRSADQFRDGVRVTVEAMLQAPEFLYRSEASHPLDVDGSVQLDDFGLASRLSYFLFDSMPDAELFAAARAGHLHTPDQLEAGVRRMLEQPRVLEKLIAFHEQAWQFGRFSGISPDASRYPNIPKNLVRRVRRATTLFVRDILQSGGGLTELLTAPFAYVDAGLAPLYGVPISATSTTGAGRFERVRFDPTERKGLLMQIGFLASNAYSINTDPIHRGLFVIRNLLCREIPDPPPGATSTPLPPTTQPIVTTRDEISVLTGQSFCPTCHSEINAPGFAFEGFDAVGEMRSLDNGAQVDTSGQMVLDGQLVHFDGPTQLIDLLAQSKEAHRCYASRWLEFAYGRPLAESDRPTLDLMAADSLPIADLIVAIVRSPAFRFLPSMPKGTRGQAQARAMLPPASSARGRLQ
jgi:hypothetical protein